jgi:exodeoxyribonuclease-3
LETRRGLPGDPDDSHSRDIEAANGGMLVGCLYLPNGNPAPGPKLDYKLRWFARLTAHAEELLGLDVPVVLAGDDNVPNIEPARCPADSSDRSRADIDFAALIQTMPPLSRRTTRFGRANAYLAITFRRS